MNYLELKIDDLNYWNEWKVNNARGQFLVYYIVCEKRQTGILYKSL